MLPSVLPRVSENYSSAISRLSEIAYSLKEISVFEYGCVDFHYITNIYQLKYIKFKKSSSKILIFLFYTVYQNNQRFSVKMDYFISAIYEYQFGS